MTSQTTPTIVRISPIVWTEMPPMVAVTASHSTSPIAMSPSGGPMSAISHCLLAWIALAASFHEARGLKPGWTIVSARIRAPQALRRRLQHQPGDAERGEERQADGRADAPDADGVQPGHLDVGQPGREAPAQQREERGHGPPELVVAQQRDEDAGVA